MNNPLTNSNGTSVFIHYKILPENKMKELGFDDLNGTLDYWYRMWKIPGYKDLTFEVSIPKPGSSKELYIDTIDENFLQPFDWQAGIGTKKAIKACKDLAEDVMKYLQTEGLLTGHLYGDYI